MMEIMHIQVAELMLVHVAEVMISQKMEIILMVMEINLIWVLEVSSMIMVTVMVIVRRRTMIKMIVRRCKLSTVRELELKSVILTQVPMGLARVLVVTRLLVALIGVEVVVATVRVMDIQMMGRVIGTVRIRGLGV
jgi:hypothetical protein